MIGIEFEYNTYGKILFDLLNKVEIDDYKFEVLEQEIISNDNNKYLPELSVGKQFFNEISTKDDYYVLELNLRLYPKNAEIKAIFSYDDFVKSDCELIILTADGYFEIYFKNNSLKNQIIKNLEDKEIAYNKKNLENDGRVMMYIHYK